MKYILDQRPPLQQMSCSLNCNKKQQCAVYGNIINTVLLKCKTRITVSSVVKGTSGRLVGQLIVLKWSQWFDPRDGHCVLCHI